MHLLSPNVVFNALLISKYYIKHSIKLIKYKIKNKLRETLKTRQISLAQCERNHAEHLCWYGLGNVFSLYGRHI